MLLAYPKRYEWSTEVIVVYGSVIIDAPREQKINMFVSSAGRNKVWLNGELIYEQLIRPAEYDYWRDDGDGFNQYFPVTLKQGPNVLLVAVGNGGTITGHFGFEEGTEYTVLPPHIIADPNLRAVIAKELGKDDSAFVSITADEMAALTVINAEDAGIKDLSGIEFATNLVHLNVRFNSITDISPIKGLNELKELRLRGNQISDFSVLTELESLKELWISGEKITDFSSLAELTNLEGFGAWGLYIDDISPLSGFTKLRWLELGHNKKDLTDISPLASIKGLKRLVLYGMGVEDISPLANLKGLKNLTIVANRVKDVLPLAELTELVFLDLSGNDIWDFSPIEGLFGKIPISTADNPGFPTEGPKIEGPWLWVLAPISGMSTMEAAASGTDFLAQMSNGTVTELEIATEGAKEGDSVGNGVWTVGKLSSSVGNINDMVNATSLEISDTNRHIAYGSIILGSPKDQKVNMLIGTSESVKIWLNGELVHNHPTGGSIDGYTGFLPVTLQKGANVVLVAIYERKEDGKKQGWTGFFGFEDGTEYTVVPPGVGLSFSSAVKTLIVGDTLTLNLNAENMTDLAGWQADIAFDPNVLEAVEVAEGDFLKLEGGDTFSQAGTIDNTAGKITGLFSVRISETGVNGSGILLSVTFKAKIGGETQVTLENFEFVSITDDIIPTVPPNITITVGDYPAWDVNQDGRVSIQDLVLVASDLGAGAPANLRTDVNRDGVVNVQDLILVQEHMDESTDSAASPVLAMDNEELMPIMVQAWIDQAQTVDDGSHAFRQGIENLQKLLASLLPEKTALLANYPNPFNPETWIPYQLAKPVDVTLTIYAANGAVVRTLALGHQAAGIYQSRSRAAYWDGRNDMGESVASGIYFYTLTAGDFTATRKMLILK
ncbi:MAG: leucine-rich repeat domain-containing protein [Candidatus Poribacteria bacterium]|nr:leucine-rich repeat domain-containing protein [Candidatus Poribacteria bacterium]